MSQLTDANNHITQFAFDANAQSTSRTLPNGQTESFAYDDRQRQTLHISFEGVHKQTLYDDSAIGGGRVLGTICSPAERIMSATPAAVRSRLTSPGNGFG